MGRPEGPPEKKQKRVTPIETKLEKLRHTVAGFNPSWEEYVRARVLYEANALHAAEDESISS